MILRRLTIVDKLDGLIDKHLIPVKYADRFRAIDDRYTTIILKLDSDQNQIHQYGKQKISASLIEYLTEKWVL